MDLGTQQSFGGSGAFGGRGRIAGLVTAGVIQDITMGDPGAGQLVGATADADFEELCNSLPGWHQQQSSHLPAGLLGGPARTVSAPSAFFLSVSNPKLSAGGAGAASLEAFSGLNTGPAHDPQQNPSGFGFGFVEDLSSSSMQHPRPLPPGVTRWLLHGAVGPSTLAGSPLRNAHFPADDSLEGVAASGMAALDGARGWPVRAPGGCWSTLLPPGEEHTSAMLHSLYPAVFQGGADPGMDPGVDLALLGQQLPLGPANRGHGVRSASQLPVVAGGGGGGSRRGLAVTHQTQQQQQQQPLSPVLAGTGLSDWPSGGRMMGGSSGLLLPAGATAATALSGPQSGPFFASHQTTSSGDPLGPLGGGGGGGGGGVAICTLGSPATGPNCSLVSAVQQQPHHPYPHAPPAPLRVSVLGLTSSSELQMEGAATVAAIAAGASEDACGAAVVAAAAAAATAGVKLAEAAPEGETGADNGMQLDMEQGEQGHGGASGASGASGMQSASSGSSMCAAINGALVAAAACDAGASGGMLLTVGSDFGDAAAVAAAEGEEHNAGGAGGSGGGSRSPGGSRAAKASVNRRPNSDSAIHFGEQQPMSDDGLQLLAMRFRNRPGRVPKAMAKLGPIAELAKSAAAGKIKLDKDELEDLVMTVETNLAKAVTEQKEDSRARNRVAQQRFRNRQRETIAALQARVEEQEALIQALQDKIQLYEAQRRQQQQHQLQPLQAVLNSSREAGAVARSGRAARRTVNE